MRLCGLCESEQQVAVRFLVLIGVCEDVPVPISWRLIFLGITSVVENIEQPVVLSFLDVISEVFQGKLRERP